MSSMNYAKYSERRKDFVFKAVFENSFDPIIEFLKAMNALGIQPETSASTPATRQPRPVARHGHDLGATNISLVMGVTGGIRPSEERGVHDRADPGGPEGPKTGR